MEKEFVTPPSEPESASLEEVRVETNFVIALTGSHGLIGEAFIRYMRGVKINNRPVKIKRVLKEAQHTEKLEALSPYTEEEKIKIKNMKLYNNEDVIYWDRHSWIDETAMQHVDAVIHLAGESLAESGSDANPSADDSFMSSFFNKLGRWTDAKKQEITHSRYDTTRVLSQAIKKGDKKPAVFLCASGVGFYGTETGDEICTEASKRGETFLAQVAEKWEDIASGVSDLTRVALMRFGVVMSARGGFMARLLPIVKKRAGGRMGSGEQWVSWISLLDCCRSIEHILKTPTIKGAVNIVAPNPIRNGELSEAMHQIINPDVWFSFKFPMPETLIRGILGEMADEVILKGQKVDSSVLKGNGFTFVHPTVEDALKDVISEDNKLHAITNLCYDDWRAAELPEINI